MTKKVVGYVRLVWVCPRCGTANPGPQKFCNGCGGPQPENVEFQQAPEERLLTDRAEIAAARRGPDVHCPYCGARNPAGAKYCGACGGDLKGAGSRAAGKALGAHRAAAAAPVVCPACGASNPAGQSACRECGSPLLPEAAQARAGPPPPSGARRWILPGGLLVGALFVGGLLLLGLRTDKVEASVASLHWERSVTIEEFGPVEREGWRDEIPADAVLGVCTSRHRTTQDQPAPQATEVCGTPYTVDTGSGYGEVQQDCVYEVFAAYCPYTVEDWSPAGIRTASGEDLAPAWPTLALGAGQRAGERSEKFEVVFSTSEQTYRYVPSDGAEFERFSLGSRWLLDVNALGGILAVSPAGP
jgi:ribosomal protein L40E